MLIVLSGIETIHKKFFAREIIAALNTFEYEGYTVKFGGTNIKISKNGKLLYQMADAEYPDGVNTLLINKEDGSSNEAGKAIVDAVYELYTQIFNEGVRNNHFHHVLSDPDYDFGLIPTTDILDTDAPNKEYVHPHKYADLIQNYQNRTFENFVVTGVFSKAFIDKVKEDLGSENVLVLNILRNPSTAFLLNEKEPEYYTLKKPYLSRSPDMDFRKLETSLLNAVILKDVPGVINLKFEDILRDGKFTVMDTEVPIPPNYNPANEWVTWWEEENIVVKKIIGKDDVDAFNKRFGAFEPTIDLLLHTDTEAQQEALDVFNEEHNSNVTLEDAAAAGEPGDDRRILRNCLPFFNAVNKSTVTVEQYDSVFPINVFERLGYTPISYETVIKPS